MLRLSMNELTTMRWSFEEDVEEYTRAGYDGIGIWRQKLSDVGEAKALELLEKGREFDLSGTLAAGGVIVFPHAGVADCGHQIATAVHACLDSGADKILAISVLHAFTDEMQDARVRVAAGLCKAAFKCAVFV